jgi:phosphoribosyl 1,2-cyclic phosphate phosphodiesterase
VQQLQGLDVLVLDALRRRHHPNHLTLDDALDVIRKLQARRAYLTHISHELDHTDVSGELPEHVQLAYDGLKVQF